MPAPVSKIEGMREAREALAKLSDHVQKLVGQVALDAAADVFVREVTARAPVSSRGGNPTPGSLKRSVRRRSARPRKGVTRREVIAEDVAAVPNEFGTSKMAAQPFFRPAIDTKRAAAAQAVADTIREEVEQGPWVAG